MPILGYSQWPIIHNRNRYQSAVLKCFEWSKKFDAWETQLDYLVKIPDLGSAAPPVGLALRSRFIMTHTHHGIFGPCGKSIEDRWEVFPLSATQQYDLVEDPQARHMGFDEVNCRLAPELLCRLESDVEITLQIGSATVDGLPLSDNDVNPDEYAVIGGGRSTLQPPRGPQRSSPEDVKHRVTFAPVSGESEFKIQYHADVDHCDPVVRAGIGKTPPDKDISAGDVPKSALSPSAMLLYYEILRRRLSSNRTAAERVVDEMRQRSTFALRRAQAVPGAHVTLARAFGERIRVKPEITESLHPAIEE